MSKEYISNYDSLYNDYQDVREDIIEILIICGDFLQTLMELGFDEYKSMVLGVEWQTGQLINDLLKKLSR